MKYKRFGKKRKKKTGIKTDIYKCKNGRISGFEISGHAGFKKKGKDIICSAVSAIVYTALGGIEEQAGVTGFIERDGYIKFDVPGDLKPDKSDITEIILRTMETGLRQVEESYKGYITIDIKERQEINNVKD